MKTMLKFLSFAAILAVAASPAAYADTLGNPGTYFGTGNSPIDWTVATGSNAATGGTVELGLKVAKRGIAKPITPSGNTYIYSPGPNTGSTGTWNYDFSVNTGSDSLDAYTYLITIVDTTQTKSHSSDPNPTALHDDALADSLGPIAGCNYGCFAEYDPTTDNGFQNSENPGFGFLPGYKPNAYDKYTITLTATSIATGDVVASDTINVVPTPEPSSLILLGTGLASAAGAMLRRRRLA